MKCENARPRRLYRSRRRLIGGVCSGIAKKLGIGTGIVRLLALVALCSAAGFWVYIILWIAIPKEPCECYSCRRVSCE